MKSPTRDDHQDVLNFAASLLGEATPRALIIIGAARLEEEVKAIVSRAAPGCEAEHRAHAFRVDLLVSLGELSADLATILKKIAKIRNHFAHTSGPAAITDAKIKDEVKSVFDGLDALIQLSQKSDSLFGKMSAKLPPGFSPQTWIDADFKKYQTAILMLLYHLLIVRCNIPAKRSPIPLDQYEFEKEAKSDSRG